VSGKFSGNIGSLFRQHLFRALKQRYFGPQPVISLCNFQGNVSATQHNHRLGLDFCGRNDEKAQ
jgi:hypothetical protein